RRPSRDRSGVRRPRRADPPPGPSRRGDPRAAGGSPFAGSGTGRRGRAPIRGPGGRLHARRLPAAAANRRPAPHGPAPIVDPSLCGICGIAGADPRGIPTSDAALRAMTDVIVHRGPDEDGFLLEPGVALGMRRLSIIDLPGGSQPIANEDQTVCTVFNGEIYNYPELRRELEARGHRFSTHSGTETIV